MTYTGTPRTQAVWRGSNVLSNLLDLSETLEREARTNKVALTIALRYCPQFIQDQVRAGVARQVGVIK